MDFINKEIYSEVFETNINIKIDVDEEVKNEDLKYLKANSEIAKKYNDIFHNHSNKILLKCCKYSINYARDFTDNWTRDITDFLSIDDFDNKIILDDIFLDNLKNFLETDYLYDYYDCSDDNTNKIDKEVLNSILEEVKTKSLDYEKLTFNELSDILLDFVEKNLDLEENTEQTFGYKEPFLIAKFKKDPKNILKFIKPINIYIEPNSSKKCFPGIKITLSCSWEDDTKMQWIIRGNEILYIGPSHDLTTNHEAEFYESYNTYVY